MLHGRQMNGLKGRHSQTCRWTDKKETQTGKQAGGYTGRRAGGQAGRRASG